MELATSNDIARPQPRRPPPLPPLHPINAIPDHSCTEMPLDLSARPCVIQSNNYLPTCRNPAVNPSWITAKLNANSSGTATSPNIGPNRMSYPREFKLMVIDYYNNNGQNKYRTCKEFQITKSMLNGWLQKIDKIKQSRPGSLKSGRSGRRPQFPDIEKQLFILYNDHLGLGKKVGNRWIRETARNLAREQCSQQELTGMCQFSERWLSNFKKRYRINLNRDWSSSGSSVGKSKIKLIFSAFKTAQNYNHMFRRFVKLL
jgi:transposase-like protein